MNQNQKSRDVKPINKVGKTGLTREKKGDHETDARVCHSSFLSELYP
ncbi:hypothetical protein P4U99_27660 [Brevibacillus agri]|nr:MULTISPECIES: hypothetical protein [Brevibacillus]MCG5252460.1 hypothetical protein [Brevibacillus agri]MCM3472203.1 hypothetical protein [Brevibacillus borstelensis]MED1646883.1 hypothetical protein [Brevibacillus agri]MED1657615.1 hypothetical protein [Brevibacillus agri]MED1690053.1 hypothetical protein [Brevibacillus agri]